MMPTKMWQDKSITRVAEPTEIAQCYLNLSNIQLSVSVTEMTKSTSEANLHELAGALGSFIACVWGIKKNNQIKA